MVGRIDELYRRRTKGAARWPEEPRQLSVRYTRRQWPLCSHDRDSILAQHLDESVKKLGIKVLKSPLPSPMANAICERVIGTIRRKCLDWLIPLSEPHLRSLLTSWVAHYNAGRWRMALGP